MATAVCESIKIVLVEPTHPGNIGAAARALKTMGLSRLCLVAPKNYPSAEATARASGADDVLHAAEVVSVYADALQDCTLVVGTSARRRSLTWPELDPTECAERLVEAAASSPVALVFGREHSGLTNRELDHCQYLVRIPANPAYSSLNLGAAVQVLAYELHKAALETGGGAAAALTDRDRPATAAEMAGLMGHLQDVATQVGFLHPAHPRLLMRRLRRLVHRSQPDRTEINILRGFLKAVQRATDGRGGD